MAELDGMAWDMFCSMFVRNIKSPGTLICSHGGPGSHCAMLAITSIL